MFEIGTSLREARVRRRLDLTDAEHDTKIRSKYLLALENEDFSVLPGSVYARGFLRTYSQYLGLDAQLYIDEYNSRFGQFEEVEESMLPGRGVLHRDDKSRMSFIRVTIVVLLIAIALLTWLGLRMDTARNQRESGVFEKNTQLIIPALTYLENVPSALSPPEPATPVPAVPLRVKLKVEAVSTASSWLKVQAGSNTGKVLYEGTITGKSKKLFAGKRLFVTIGYPSALKLSIPKQAFTSSSADTLTLLVTPTRIKQVECQERCL